jgi:queuine tRNA-ribosyltransferase
VVTDSAWPLEILARDRQTLARRGRLRLAHGTIDTPAFMPVGTQGTVKGLTMDQVAATGAQIVLGNTYHLHLRPGSPRIAKLGGLHAFTGWSGPILTDSGGFQIFSLADLATIDENGARFKSHLDGSLIRLTPEDAIRIQEDLGSDIAMVLDHVVGLPAAPERVEEATQRSIRWAERCKNAASRGDQALFGIVQGGLDLDLRLRCAQALIPFQFHGYAIGGLSVGESAEDMIRILQGTCPSLPEEKPRYLMGVGRPIDLLQGIASGVDMFDCVMPTRNGRNALAFTDDGPLRMRNQRHADDASPIQSGCPCLACKHSRAYIRHLFLAEEMLGPILLSHHNLTYYQELMRQARKHIQRGDFGDFLARKRSGWGLPNPS